VKVGVIGLGFGATHLEWLAECPTLSLVALGYHRDRTRARRLADQHGVTEVTDDCLGLAADPRLAAVVVVSPPHTHLELARPALARSAVVVVDKPLAHTLDDARELSTIAASTGARTMVTFQWREHRGVQMLRDEFSLGALGSVLFVDITYHHDFLAGGATAWPWRHDSRTAGAGAMGDMGVHAFDLLRWITGLEWTVDDARLSRSSDVRDGPSGPVRCDTEDLALLTLTAVGPPTTARVMVSRASPGHRLLEITLVGTAGASRLRADPVDGSGRLDRLAEPPSSEHIAASSLNPYPRLVGDISRDARTVPDFAAGAAASSLVDAASRLASPRRAPTLTGPE
jgi:predicted dehydrogenase